jgi:hypothetical protein
VNEVLKETVDYIGGRGFKKVDGMTEEIFFAIDFRVE